MTFDQNENISQYFSMLGLSCDFYQNLEIPFYFKKNENQKTYK